MARRIDFKLLVFTYKAVHGDAPKYLSDLVCPDTPARALRSASDNMLTVRRTHVKAGDSSFAVAAATLWNNLLNDIKMQTCHIFWVAICIFDLKFCKFCKILYVAYIITTSFYYTYIITNIYHKMHSSFSMRCTFD